MVEAVIAVGVVVAIIAAIVLAFVHERKRREAFRAEAARLGLQYEPALAEALRPEFSLFNQGFGRKARNVLHGTYRNVPVRLFEFEYKTQTHDGKNTRTQTHHVGVAMALLARHPARTTIVPENLGHKLWDAVGGDDIDFESDEFSRKYWVKSSDRRAAYDLVHPRMMEYLMAPGWQRWEVVAAGVVAYQNGRFAPKNAQAILDRLVGFVELMPMHGGRAPIAVGAAR